MIKFLYPLLFPIALLFLSACDTHRVYEVKMKDGRIYTCNKNDLTPPYVDHGGTLNCDQLNGKRVMLPVNDMLSCTEIDTRESQR